MGPFQQPKITIPTPCHESWADMTVAEKGRFCDSCEKVVFDFTSSTHEEIAETYDQNQGKVCGRFRTTQIHGAHEKEMSKRRYMQFLRNFAFAALIAFGAFLFSINDIMAQQTIRDLHGKIFQVEQMQTNDIVISGKVIDELSGEVVVGADVYYENAEGKLIGTVTDNQGRFELPIPANEIVERDKPLMLYGYSMGYIMITHPIGPMDTEGTELTLVLPMEEFELMGDVAFEPIDPVPVCTIKTPVLKGKMKMPIEDHPQPIKKGQVVIDDQEIIPVMKGDVMIDKPLETPEDDVDVKESYILKGKVIDVDTKEPLPFANVVIDGTMLGGMTDFDGNYEIEVQPEQLTDEGMIALKTSLIGYESKMVKRMLRNDERGKEVRIKMEPVEIEMDSQIWVVGEIMIPEHEDLLNNDPAETGKTTITQEEIRRSPRK